MFLLKSFSHDRQIRSRKRARSQSSETRYSDNEGDEVSCCSYGSNDSDGSSIEIVVDPPREDPRPIYGGKRPPGGKTIPPGIAEGLLRPHKRRATSRIKGLGYGKTISQTVPRTFQPREHTSIVATTSHGSEDEHAEDTDNNTRASMSYSPAPSLSHDLLSSTTSSVLPDAFDNLNLARSQSQPGLLPVSQQQSMLVGTSQSQPDSLPFASAFDLSSQGFFSGSQSQLAPYQLPFEGVNGPLFQFYTPSQLNTAFPVNWGQYSAGPAWAPGVHQRRSNLGQSQSSAFNLTITPSNQPINLSLSWNAHAPGDVLDLLPGGPFAPSQQRLNISISSSSSQGLGQSEQVHELQKDGQMRPRRKEDKENATSNRRAECAPENAPRSNPPRASPMPLQGKFSEDQCISQPVVSDSDDVSMAAGTTAHTVSPGPRGPPPARHLNGILDREAPSGVVSPPEPARHRSPGDISVPSPSRYKPSPDPLSNDAVMDYWESHTLSEQLFRG